MATCSGVCKRFKYTKSHNEKWYINGVKRCNFCKIFIKVERFSCPCCKKLLRTNGRNSDVKNKRIMERIE